MKLQRPKEAALQFSELVELKPGEKQMALAKLRLGDAFRAMGDKDTSKLFYDEVATKYAGTPEGDKAKRALKSKR
jgi:TolA-binding protein